MPGSVLGVEDTQMDRTGQIPFQLGAGNMSWVSSIASQVLSQACCVRWGWLVGSESWTPVPAVVVGSGQWGTLAKGKWEGRG